MQSNRWTEIEPATVRVPAMAAFVPFLFSHENEPPTEVDRKLQTLGDDATPRPRARARLTEVTERAGAGELDGGPSLESVLAEYVQS